MWWSGWLNVQILQYNKIILMMVIIWRKLVIECVCSNIELLYEWITSTSSGECLWMADEAYHPILEMYSKWLRSQLAATFHACIIVIACTCTLRYSWTILEVRILVTSEIHKNSNEVLATITAGHLSRLEWWQLFCCSNYESRLLEWLVSANSLLPQPQK